VLCGTALRSLCALTIIRGRAVQAHIDELAAQCRAAEDEILSARLERASFERLAEAERAALPRRLEVLRTEVAAVQARERALQLKYSALKVCPLTASPLLSTSPAMERTVDPRVLCNA